MNVRTLCLSILHDGEASGYDIRRMCTEEEFAYFVEASYGSIYPALAKLEDEKLVTSRSEQQAGKPARKVYSITPAGRAALTEELCGPLGEDMFRSPFLLFTRFAHILPAEIVAQRCEEMLERTASKRQKLERVEGQGDCSPADKWVIDFGRTVLDASEKYLRAHKHELIAMAQSQIQKDAAE